MPLEIKNNQTFVKILIYLKKIKPWKNGQNTRNKESKIRKKILISAKKIIKSQKKLNASKMKKIKSSEKIRQYLS